MLATHQKHLKVLMRQMLAQSHGDEVAIGQIDAECAKRRKLIDQIQLINLQALCVVSPSGKYVTIYHLVEDWMRELEVVIARAGLNLLDDLVWHSQQVLYNTAFTQQAQASNLASKTTVARKVLGKGCQTDPARTVRARYHIIAKCPNATVDHRAKIGKKQHLLEYLHYYRDLAEKANKLIDDDHLGLRFVASLKANRELFDTFSRKFSRRGASNRPPPSFLEVAQAAAQDEAKGYFYQEIYHDGQLPDDKHKNPADQVQEGSSQSAPGGGGGKAAKKKNEQPNSGQQSSSSSGQSGNNGNGAPYKYCRDPPPRG
ncbi:hypothetical protein BC940DRAFT_320722 [Gongronella butleri]|nr:hypothetical protein BC940DRAFT_320722 [Gongronella butleri]